MTSKQARFAFFNSLRARIMLSALIVIVVLLPSIGIALNNAFAQQIQSNLEDQLNAYFYSVLAVTEVENNDLIMPEVLLDNQFNVINSGLYALITRAGDEQIKLPKQQTSLLWFSNSFLSADISQQWPSNLPKPSVGESSFTTLTLNDAPHFVYSFSVRFEGENTNTDLNKEASSQIKSAPITLHIVKDMTSITEQLDAFSQKIWTWLLVLMAVLLLIQLCWLVWTLKPLAKFTEELNAVQRAEVDTLSQAYPNELRAVATQLNALLDTEKRQRQRYRNALADLAHSLKTPLAAILSQKDLSESSMEQLQQINHTISHQLKRAQSAGHNPWHLGLKVQSVADKLLRTLSKIYPDIELRQSPKSQAHSVFKGDEADLTEILGNLLDNACKAAVSRVHLSFYEQDNKTVIIVEDDGNGVSNAEQSRILERGKRADTYPQGHGIGLAIVRDLVDNYQGSLAIDSSDTLGGARFTLRFSS